MFNSRFWRVDNNVLFGFYSQIVGKETFFISHNKMPQEAWVLKCYQCSKYQVQLKKKAKKWQCKVCGAKQDLMTIFFKGQPSDCRVNVQNMNAAEGQVFEKLKESLQDEHYYEDDEEENIYQEEETLSESISFSNQNSANFVEEALSQFEDAFDQLEHEFRPSAFDLDGFNESQERSFKENVSMHGQSVMNDSQSINNCSEPNKDENYFDLNSIDFTIKTYKPPAVRKKEPLKLSIFESNRDFDESLDF